MIDRCLFHNYVCEYSTGTKGIICRCWRSVWVFGRQGDCLWWRLIVLLVHVLIFKFYHFGDGLTQQLENFLYFEIVIIAILSGYLTLNSYLCPRCPLQKSFSTQ